MDLISYIVLITGIFVFSVTIWFYWVNGYLKSETSEKTGIEQAEPTARIEATELKRSLFTPNIIAPTKQPQPEKIERELKIQYKKSIYVNRSFPLTITVAADKGKITVSEAEKKISITEIKKLNFEAFEKEPRVTVELKFAEDDFKINKTKKIQKLNASEDTEFRFTVTPLKAEDCILTIVFSYIDKIPLLKTIEEVTIDKTTDDGKTEHSKQIKKVPVPDDEKEIEIKSVDLKIKVKKLLGMNAQQLDLVKRIAPIAFAVVVFVYQVATSELPLTDAIVQAIPPALAITGIEGADKIGKFLGAKEDDNSQ